MNWHNKFLRNSEFFYKARLLLPGMGGTHSQEVHTEDKDLNPNARVERGVILLNYDNFILEYEGAG